MKYDWNYIDRDFGPGAVRCAAKLAPQPELGLLPERRTRTCPLHRGHPSCPWPNLSPCTTRQYRQALAQGWRLLSVCGLALLLVVFMCRGSLFAYARAASGSAAAGLPTAGTDRSVKAQGIQGRLIHVFLSSSSIAEA